MAKDASPRVGGKPFGTHSQLLLRDVGIPAWDREAALRGIGRGSANLRRWLYRFPLPEGCAGIPTQRSSPVSSNETIHPPVIVDYYGEELHVRTCRRYFLSSYIPFEQLRSEYVRWR